MNPLEIIESSLNFPHFICLDCWLRFDIFVLRLSCCRNGCLNVISDIRESENGIGLLFRKLPNFDGESFKERINFIVVFVLLRKRLYFFVQWGVVGFFDNNVRIFVVFTWDVDGLLDILMVVFILTAVFTERHSRFIPHASNESLVVRRFFIFFLLVFLVEVFYYGLYNGLWWLWLF